MAAQTTYGFADLKAGTVWEHYASTVIRDGELNGRYRLDATVVPPKNHHDPIVHLINLETGGGRQGLLESAPTGAEPPAASALEVGRVNPILAVALAHTLAPILELVAWCSLVDREASA